MLQAKSGAMRQQNKFIFTSTTVALVFHLLLCVPSFVPVIGFCFRPTNQRPTIALGSSPTLIRDTSTTGKPLQGVKAVVVGAGPSGLLLTHKLLQAGATVDLFERRQILQRGADDNNDDKSKYSIRAYALGLGIRGRTAIRSVDENLWRAVEKEGCRSARFQIRFPFSIGGEYFKIQLRDENDGGEGVEPSLLLFQSDLCTAMAHELERRYGDQNCLTMHLGTKVSTIDFEQKQLKANPVDKEDQETRVSFDVVFGCDGVNSVVRKAIADSWPSFEQTQTALPGEFKVVRLEQMPPLLDPTAVALVLPKKGSQTAFVEPTSRGRCCILFAGSSSGGEDGKEEDIISSKNATAVQRMLEERFPVFQGGDMAEAAKQLAQADLRMGASVVQCNTFNYAGVAALVGDAAHATGGVSGQGVNSALMDSVVLADALAQHFESGRKDETLRKALLSYSLQQFPEAKALYDLSFGPKPKSTFKSLLFGFKNARDALFKGRLGIGKLPLQTELTTSLRPFAEVRKDRNFFYDEDFPSQAEWNEKLVKLDERSTK